MRTTVQLDASLVAEAKKYATESGTTLTSLLEEALRESLARRKPQVKSKPVHLKTVTGGGVRAGVNLDDGAALLDLMDS